jgi:hypothetical protein
MLFRLAWLTAVLDQGPSELVSSIQVIACGGLTRRQERTLLRSTEKVLLGQGLEGHSQQVVQTRR